MSYMIQEFLFIYQISDMIYEFLLAVSAIRHDVLYDIGAPIYIYVYVIGWLGVVFGINSTSNASRRGVK